MYKNSISSPKCKLFQNKILLNIFNVLENGSTRDGVLEQGTSGEVCLAGEQQSEVQRKECEDPPQPALVSVIEEHITCSIREGKLELEEGVKGLEKLLLLCDKSKGKKESYY